MTPRSDVIIGSDWLILILIIKICTVRLCLREGGGEGAHSLY
jgi:hypothetical protein